MELVQLESPFAKSEHTDVEHHILYAQAAARDCLLRGEAPFASHLLYPQPNILDDNKPADRRLGIEAGLCWGRKAEKTVIYTDFGISEGMHQGIERAVVEKRPFEYRSFGFSLVKRLEKMFGLALIARSNEKITVEESFSVIFDLFAEKRYTIDVVGAFPSLSGPNNPIFELLCTILDVSISYPEITVDCLHGLEDPSRLFKLEPSK